MASELDKLEAVPAEILAWLKHIAESLHIVHAATPNAAPLPAPPPNIVTTMTVPAGFMLGRGNVALDPVTPAALFALFTVAQVGISVGFSNVFGTWNQMEYLRQMDAVAFANWCADARNVPGLGGGTSGYGWLTGLTDQGLGFFEMLALAPNSITVPNTDPRVL